MADITCIRNAGWVVQWDSERDGHCYGRDRDVAFSADGIVHVGDRYEGPVACEIDGRGLLVMPGLVNIHSHPMTEGSYKGIREEHGVPAMHMTGLYERSCAFSLDDDGRQAAIEVAYAELMQSGVTTLVDLSAATSWWIDLAARSGLRTVLGPGFVSARWRLENDHVLGFEWDEAAGRRGLDEALALIDRAREHPSGRLDGIVSPGQIETCTPELLADAFAAAEERGLRYTTHISQSVIEFNEMVRRHGKSPVRFAADLGLLSERTILAHCLFVDTHSQIRWHTRDDVGRLASAGVTVAHCPTPFARYGAMLESFGDYLSRGVNLAVGTDTAPHNLLEEMRLALTLGHVAAGDVRAPSTAQMFDAATVGGARALGRADIGRLAPGAQADLVLVSLSQPEMRPLRDPLKSLIYHAADRAVRTVFVAGEAVVRDGRAVHLDREDALGRLEEAQARMMAGVPARDFRGRSADAIAPLTLPQR